MGSMHAEHFHRGCQASHHQHPHERCAPSAAQHAASASAVNKLQEITALNQWGELDQHCYCASTRASHHDNIVQAHCAAPGQGHDTPPLCGQTPQPSADQQGAAAAPCRPAAAHHTCPKQAQAAQAGWEGPLASPCEACAQRCPRVMPTLVSKQAPCTFSCCPLQACASGSQTT